MWYLIHKVLGLVLLTAAAAAVYVIGAIGWTWWQGTEVPRGAAAAATRPPDTRPAPRSASVEIRVTSQGGVSQLFPGQPLVFDVVLLNFDARRARDREPAEPRTMGPTAEGFVLDSATTSWERRLALSLRTADGVEVLEELDWAGALLGEAPPPSDRRLGFAPARAIFILNGADSAELAPGPYLLEAVLPPEVVPPGRVRVVPLPLEMREAPTRDVERALVALAVAEVALLEGDPPAALDAATTTLELDPLQDRALAIMAAAHEAEGNLREAIEWYERYLSTIPNRNVEDRARLATYLDALRQQVEP